MTYLRNFWLALCGMPGHMVMRNATFDDHCAHVLRMEERIAQYERRSKGQRDAIAARKAATPAPESQAVTQTAAQSSAQE